MKKKEIWEIKVFFFFLFNLCSTQSLKGVRIGVEQIDLCIML